MANNKLNILFLASWYPNKLNPLNGNFIQKHAQAVALSHNVFTLHIIANEQTQKFDAVSKKNETITETTVYYKKIKGNSPLHKYLKYRRRHNAYLLGLKTITEKNGKIDLTHLNVTFPAGLFAVYLFKKHDIPYITTEHWTVFLNNHIDKFKGYEKRWIKQILNKAKLICPVSEDLQYNMEKFNPNTNYKIVPNVVNTNIFKPSTNKRNNSKKRILHISNLRDEQKNLTGIINTIKKLNEERNDFTITIAGDGKQDEYHKLIKELAIPRGTIYFEGVKTDIEIARLFQTHDAFLLFSNYETFSVVIAEAWCCGIPVISSVCGGITNEINSSSGLTVEKGNETDLQEKLNQFLDGRVNFSLTQISEMAQQRFSYEAVNQQFSCIYKEVLGID